MKMIVEKYFSEDFRRIPAKMISRTESAADTNVACLLDWFEECAKWGTVKRVETEKEIRFDKTLDCFHFCSTFFIKEA